METPKYYEFMNPTLQALRERGGTLTNEEIVDAVATRMRLPEEVLERQQHGHNLSEVEYRIAWAKSYLKQAGYLTQSERGVWALTPKGRDTPRINERAIVTAIRKAFERLSQRLLRESGFTQVEVTGRSRDGGIDGKGVLRLGGLINFQVVFQSKRYAGTVSAGIVRDFRGAMIGRADKGLIISTGTFSRDARAEAIRDGAPAIDLVDGQELAELLKKYTLGVKTVMVEKVEVDGEWFKTI